MRLQRFVEWYKKFALYTFNIIIGFILLNGLLWAVSLVKPNLLKGPSKSSETEMLPVYQLGPLSYGFDSLRQVYPGMPDDQIARLILENWNVPLACDSDMQSREQAFDGYYVHVSFNGYRLIKDQGSWPPKKSAYNIFVFGGSTTFGYGQPDEKTIPSFLQERLRESLGTNKIVVYNFGHSFFFSVQERVNFEGLIKKGIVPNLAIFIDGLNEFYHWDGVPTLRPCSDQGPLAQLKNTVACQPDELCWPVQTAAPNLAKSLSATRPTTQADTGPTAPALDDTATNTLVINRWLQQKAAIEALAGIHNVQTLFVLQPIPAYAYYLKYDPFVADLAALGPHARGHWGYSLWENIARGDTDGWTRNFLDLAHLGESKSAPLYVDVVHYTDSFANEIASAIASAIVERNLIGQQP